MSSRKTEELLESESSCLFTDENFWLKHEDDLEEANFLKVCSAFIRLYGELQDANGSTFDTHTGIETVFTDLTRSTSLLENEETIF